MQTAPIAYFKDARLAILIPAYEPGKVLVRLVHQLTERFAQSAHRPGIVIVDDGSTGEEARQILAGLRERENVQVITHPANRGKGAALKTGIAFAQTHGIERLVTADADGQHTPEDIAAVAELAANTDRYILGTRSFSGSIPWRSRLGNTVTSALARLLFGLRLGDTQSGLRAFPRRLYGALLEVGGDRYEYEFNSLVTIGRADAIMQIPIETVYEPGNPTSHFRPLIDSALVYSVFARYVSAAALLGALDVSAYFLLSYFVEPATAFLIVRPVTVVIYFVIMREKVFFAHSNIFVQSVKYAVLVVFNMVILYLTAKLLGNRLPVWPLVVYLGCTMGLFVFNYMAQRYVIFRK